MTTPKKLKDALTDNIVENLLVETEPYLSCDECFEQLDVFVERSLADPSWGDEQMQTHLRGCGACAEEAATLMELASS